MMFGVDNSMYIWDIPAHYI